MSKDWVSHYFRHVPMDDPLLPRVNVAVARCFPFFLVRGVKGASNGSNGAIARVLLSREFHFGYDRAIPSVFVMCHYSNFNVLGFRSSGRGIVSVVGAWTECGGVVDCLRGGRCVCDQFWFRLWG